MDAPATQEKLPVAVTVRPVLTLIKCHQEGDQQGFKNAAMEVVNELGLNGEDDLALYILAQFGMVNTFVPQ